MARQDPDRTIGRRAEAWHQSLLAGVDAGRIDVSRYGAYRRNLAVFVEWIGSAAKVESLTEEALELFYAELAKRGRDTRYSPDHARTIFGATKTFVSWLVSNKTIPLPGNLSSRNVRYGTGRTANAGDLFTVEEIERLLGAAEDRFRLYLLLMLNCGMYQSDVSDLGEDEVNWAAGTIERPRSKSAKVAKYKLWPRTFDLLKAQRNRDHPVFNERGGRRVLATSEGKPLCDYRIEGGNERRYDTIQAFYKRIKEKLGLTKPMKNLRKTSATMLGKHPPSKFYAQYFLAHSPQTVADRNYVIRRDDVFFEALDRLAMPYGL